MIGIAIFS